MEYFLIVVDGENIKEQEMENINWGKKSQTVVVWQDVKRRMRIERPLGLGIRAVGDPSRAGYV